MSFAWTFVNVAFTTTFTAEKAAASIYKTSVGTSKGFFLLNVCQQTQALDQHLIKRVAHVQPDIGKLRELRANVVDQIHLKAQGCTSSVFSLDELPIVDHGETRIHKEIHLVSSTPDAHDIIRLLLLV